MTLPTIDELSAGLRDGSIAAYLGPAALRGAVDAAGTPIPADSESLILAMNGGRPMAPKLMYEFPRAAMNLELKKGRSFVNRFLSKTYADTAWSRAPLHDWLAAVKPRYVIDINRDTQLQDSYKDTPHLLIQGIARMAGGFRFRIYQWDGASYHTVTQDEADTALPVLFKPMGCPHPEPSYIAADADYVDYITKLMGGFAIPSFLKQRRQGLRYLLLGLRLTRDTERMVMSNIVCNAAQPAGWALLPDATPKERRFCANLGIEIIDADYSALLDGVLPNQEQSAAL
ncbi:SIR2 family protein [Sulfurivermis fontis]|jgi:hypothetical protein|uniref:SIR2 family protein n=1 Tax=Sulfurivermis fontis TaxID=1972068 RepID=UPI000FD6F9FF|nr:SIR2 family protein [Sulfurivermis fontis]